VIIAEPEFGEGADVRDTILEDQIHDFGQSTSKVEVLHFLNELGWLFQRNRNSLLIDNLEYALTRFQFLFTFSVERDCCALVKTLLDILLQREGYATKGVSGDAVGDLALLVENRNEVC